MRETAKETERTLEIEEQHKREKECERARETERQSAGKRKRERKRAIPAMAASFKGVHPHIYV